MITLLMAAVVAAASPGTPPAPSTALLAEVRAERASLERQQRDLDAQRLRLDALEARLAGTRPLTPPVQQARAVDTQPTPITVGQAPTEPRQIEVRSLPVEGGILSRAGRLTLEGDIQYTRADDNRTLFRGVQIPASVLIGVFDITENHQDLLTAGLSARLGLSSKLEFNARVPFVYRSERTEITPVAEPASQGNRTSGGTVHASGLGDIEFGARYQLTGSDGAKPYLIAGLQGVAPTGSDPYHAKFDDLGNALGSSTGAGFWAVTPTLTAIFPSDPAVLYGSIGFTKNFARTINRSIGPAFVERVAPGSEPSVSVGVALSINPDLSVSLGYAHTMVLGSRSRLRAIDAVTGAFGPAVNTRTRDLQLGRLLLGLSYRVGPTTTLNWALEAGQTEDAPDLRLSLRIPLVVGR